MERLKAAIIGCGNRSQAHAKAALEGGCLELIHACDIIPEKADACAEKWGAKATYAHKDVLDDPDVDVVLIVTNVDAHLPIALDALDAGKHVVVEKPVGDRLDLAEELVKKEAETGLVVYVSFQLRFMPEYARLKQLSDEICVKQILFERQRGMMRDHFLNPSPFCGLFDFVPHDCDQVSWYMDASPIAITAVTRQNTFTRDTGATDLMSALVDFGDGRSAVILSSIGAAEIGNRIDLVGDKGNISVSAGSPERGAIFEPYSLKVGGKTPKQPLPELVKPDCVGDAALQRAFATEIRTGERSHAARPADGLSALRFTLACHQSGQEGCRRIEL
ncbi:MAG: Gfo/Idh/MocA family oxidoreductase [Lentisphaeria bacterium]|nr:Gfo/Idh/MocA family oxidoreductase [Lentisphaeria bacterium]